MIIDGLYQGEDLDVAKKIKRTKNAILKSLIQSDSAASNLRHTLSQLSSQRNDLQKAIDHLVDIEAHFRELCISKKIKDY